MKKGQLKRGITSLILTSVILIVLILVVPAQAVEVSISTDKLAYKVGEVVTFTFKIDIKDQERVPIKELTLKLNGMEKCKFKPNGEIISGCQDMIITPVQVLNYGYGYRQGTGYGSDGTSIGVKQTIYGYGYGYGYVPMEPSELKYEVKWQTKDGDFGQYDAILEAFAQNGENSFTYISNTAPFKIRKGVLATNAKADVEARGGQATIKELPYEGSPKDSTYFYADLRTVDSEATGGKITLNADLYKADGTHTTLEVRMKPKILDDFHRDMIEVEGLAQITIKTTKKGTKNVKIIDEVHVVAEIDIKNRKVHVFSEDADNPFNVEDMKITMMDYREYEKKIGVRKGIPTQLIEVFRLSY
ncbi:MAG: hypothetical protein QW404_02975 [Candidatus Nanoarchaeia archaeon]